MRTSPSPPAVASLCHAGWECGWGGGGEGVGWSWPLPQARSSLPAGRDATRPLPAFGGGGGGEPRRRRREGGGGRGRWPTDAVSSTRKTPNQAAHHTTTPPPPAASLQSLPHRTAGKRCGGGVGASMTPTPSSTHSAHRGSRPHNVDTLRGTYCERPPEKGGGAMRVCQMQAGNSWGTAPSRLSAPPTAAAAVRAAYVGRLLAQRRGGKGQGGERERGWLPAC